MELRYYSQEMHAAAFALPAFLQRRLEVRPQLLLCLRSSEGSKKRRLSWQ